MKSKSDSMTKLIITSQFSESSSGYRGKNEEWGGRSGQYFRFVIDNEYRTGGSFNIRMLETYEKIFNVEFSKDYKPDLS